MGNGSLQVASREKNDEFFTRLEDIEDELRHYKQEFSGKTVFCNCDDPEYSNFWKYFQLNFYFLGLKKLIATHYERGKASYKMEITRREGKNGQMGVPDYIKTPLSGDGDFRSDECVEILKTADVVVTNPPFSLFRDYMAQLIAYKKKFIIIGNQNCITYKEIFPLIKENKVWLGYRYGAQTFRVPIGFERDNTFIKDGEKYAKFGNICWFTNLDVQKRHETLLLYKKYDEKEYPRYDNYDAINVDKVSEIPADYEKEMGVPVTFMTVYNPEQFEIVGKSDYLAKVIVIEGSKKSGRFYVNGKRMYDRIVIRRKRR